MADKETNGNGDVVKFKWPTIFSAITLVLTIAFSFIYTQVQQNQTAIAAYTNTTNDTLDKIRERKATKEELKECKISLTVNMGEMERRIMQRLDALDGAIASHNKESLEALKEQLRKQALK
jgi:hypothetical protein